MKKSIFPNLVTLYNLLCGCVAMISVLNEWYGVAFLCFIMALIADFADGLVARALDVSSEMGKQLDSLADMISFGAVPGTILFALLAKSWYGDVGYQQYFPWLALPGFLFTGFAAYRLGKFNIDTRQTEEFRGLATPGATVFVVGIMMAYQQDFYGLATSLINPWFLYIATVIISILMISDVKMFSFKVKNTRWKGNELRYIFIFAAIIGLFLFQYLGLSLAVLLYVTLSLVFTNRKSTIEIA
jgi:CDP-diacylglycerol--serine O-phosphatidyltransferase